ncbi:hypothetical protein [Bacillus sp. EB600]|uniref:hypothetical protein n=1 Tax=Bacillus sp. EB600 TaxID=2806345 RepID=UPI00210D515F|nr:hypothetical protein [Bacillus sp. EB600]MCQ6280015.1 hypothetical protein [Bacillus sp. EB600]
MKKKFSIKQLYDKERRSLLFGFVGILTFLGCFLFKKECGFWGIKQANQIEELKEQLAGITMLLVTNPPTGLTKPKGDGLTDDTATIQAIMNYASSNNIKTIEFPSKTFVVHTLNLPSTELHLVGNNTTMKGVSTSNSVIFNQSNRAFTEIVGFEFSNCKRGIQFILPTNSSTSFDYRILRCKFTSIDGADKYGIYMDGCREGIIKDCYSHLSSFLYHTRCVNPQLENCIVNSGTYAVNGDGDGTAYSTGIRAQNITMLGCTYGIIAKSSDDGTLIGCMIDYCENPITFDCQDNFKISDSYISTNGVNNNPVIRIKNTNNDIPRGIKIHHNNLVQRGKSLNSVIDIVDAIQDSEIVDNSISFYQEAGISYKGSLAENLKILNNEFSGTGSNPRYCVKSVDNSGNSANRFEGNTCSDEMFNTSHYITSRNNRLTNTSFKTHELTGSVLLTSGSTFVNVTFSRTFYSTPHHVFLSGPKLKPTYESLTTTGMVIKTELAPTEDTTIYYSVKHLYAV